ncbi:uncharacterized protein LOC108203821 [Daucus carota subsp. sativus]|uniref:uncharacterized protein LOC108203821 n=1 Tax=Daucus carota subsp. sativus TaxID=79200 RepID=UPI003082E828
MTFHLHHNGEFTKEKYVGGSVITYGDMDLDLFSYSVLMEWVKELGYAEIGGVYVRKEKGWELVTKDADINVCILESKTSELDLFVDCDVDKGIEPAKQMQPHVIVRPKKNPIKATVKNPNKRKFVTLKDINHEKEQRLVTARRKISFKLPAASETKKTDAILKADVMKEKEKEGKKLIGSVTEYADLVYGKYDLVEGCGEVGGTEEVDKGVGVGKNTEKVKKGAEVGVGKDTGVKKGAGVGVGKDAEEVKKGAGVGVGKDAEEVKKGANPEIPGTWVEKAFCRDPCPKKPNNRKAFSDDKESDNYDPKNDSDQSSDNEEDMAISKRKKKAGKSVLGSGPRTRSRASRIVLPPPVKQVNDAVEVEVNKEVEANDDTPKVSTVERLKLMRTNAPGSMAAYLQLREQEKMQAALETTQQSQSLTENLQQPGTPPGQPEEEEKQRKPRGKSKLTHVHTRGEKREIKLSDLGQPVDDDEHLIREFSNFLGTTVREFVSLTCRSWTEVPQKDIMWEYVKDKYVIPEEGYDWVMTTMRDLFRGYKARIRRDYYYKYQTGEERLENRPREVPLKDFKILLEYWADEKIAKKARTNSESRRLITETHTAGSRSFAQISHNMALERALKATREQPPAPISDADVYVKTRKRESTRTYKLPTEDVEKKVKNVEKLLKDGTIDEADEVVYGGKDHSRTFLVGRLIEKREP